MKISSNAVQLNVSERDKGDIALVFLHYWGGSAISFDSGCGSPPATGGTRESRQGDA
jgi:hypothetical protein